MLECVKHLQFEAVEECCTTFWQPENEQEEMEEDDCMSNEFVVSFLKYCLLFIILFIHIILFDFKKIFLNFICKLLQKKSLLEGLFNVHGKFNCSRKYLIKECQFPPIFQENYKRT